MSQSLIDYLKKNDLSLSDIQYEAVTALNGPTALISAPGSGKTTVTVIRLANLIVKGKVDPGRILALTFSKAAAKDMGRRFAELFPTLAGRLQFSTIHSLAFSIIKQTGENYRFLDKPETPSKRQVLTGLYLEATGEYMADYEYEAYAAGIGLLKNLLIEPSQKVKIQRYIEDDLDKFVQVYTAYEAYKKSQQLLDFDDILTLGLQLLQTDETLLQTYQSHFTHVQVDEAQDISTAQWELIKLLALPQNNLFLVGDDDQSIYGFRGADPGIFLKFKEIPQAKIIAMNENYRSSADIVAMSSAFIQENKNRHQKKIVTSNSAKSLPSFCFFQREADQFEHLAKILQEPSSKSIAVLYRQNVSAIGLMKTLDDHQIPYALHEEKLGFYNHPVLRDVKAFFQLASNPYDEAAFRRIAKINYLPAIAVREVTSQSELPFLRYLGSRVRFQKAFQKSKASELAAKLPQVASLPPARALHYILMTLGYEEYLYKKGFLKEEKNRPLYTQAKAVLETIRSFAKSSENASKFLEQLQHPPKKTAVANVHLMTFHSAKGLEFDHVYLLDCMNEITPSKSSQNKKEEGDLEEYEEERRLFYVAMTRAREKLEILGSANRYFMDFSRSDFFKEARQAAGAKEMAPVAAPLKKVPLASLMDAPNYEDYGKGAQIKHARFGIGTVLERDGEIATISFADETRRISLRITLEKGILKKA